MDDREVAAELKARQVLVRLMTEASENASRKAHHFESGLVVKAYPRKGHVLPHQSAYQFRTFINGSNVCDRSAALRLLGHYC